MSRGRGTGRPALLTLSAGQPRTPAPPKRKRVEPEPVVLEVENQSEPPTKRRSRPSAKVAANAQETLEREIAVLRKRTKDAEKQAAESTFALKESNRVNRELVNTAYDRYEEKHGRPPPEEEEGADEDQSFTFSTAIQSRGSMSPDPAQPPRIRRRQGEARPIAYMSSVVTPVPDQVDSTQTPGQAANSLPSTPIASQTVAEDISLKPDEEVQPGMAFQAPQMVPNSAGNLLQHYTGMTKLALHLAIDTYEVHCLMVDAYPGTERQFEWSQSIWKKSCELYELEPQMLTEGMQRLLTYRGSRVRAHVRTVLRPFIVQYGFSPSSDPPSIKKNRALAAALLNDSSFRYKDPFKRERCYDHPAVFGGIKAAAFGSRKDHGVHFYDTFNPIRPEFIALVCTMIEFLIGEWSTGVFVSGKLSEDIQRKRYQEVHYQRIDEFMQLDPIKLDKKFRRWCERARTLSGVGPAEVKPEVSLMSKEDRAAARAELDAKSGDTDSEAGSGNEGEYVDDDVDELEDEPEVSAKEMQASPGDD